MDGISRIKIVAGMDAIVAIFLFIVGILVTILGFGYMDTMSQSLPHMLAYHFGLGQCHGLLLC